DAQRGDPVLGCRAPEAVQRGVREHEVRRGAHRERAAAGRVPDLDHPRVARSEVAQPFADRARMADAAEHEVGAEAARCLGALVLKSCRLSLSRYIRSAQPPVSASPPDVPGATTRLGHQREAPPARQYQQRPQLATRGTTRSPGASGWPRKSVWTAAPSAST